MDIAGSLLKVVGQDQVHEFDDGRLFTRTLEFIKRHLLIIQAGFQIQFHRFLVGVGNLLVDFLQLNGVLGAIIFFNGFQDGSFTGYNRFYIESRHELDVVHGKYIRGIRGCNCKSTADSAEGNHQIFLSYIRGNQFYGRLVNFKKGEIVLDWSDSQVLTQEQANKVPEEDKKFLYYPGDKIVLVTSPARFVNHSCDPNTFIRGFFGIAKRDIKKGEEITEDYSKEHNPGFKMECRCGSKNCKKIITAFGTNKEN